MATISLCMIVKNEEDVLARCLDSVRDAVDEIVIADTGSTDATREIAKRYTGKVYDFQWVDDFSAARNFAFSKATMDYCMWLDADDILLPPDAESLRTLKESLDPSVDVIMLPYHIAFGPDGRPTFSYNRERIIKNNAGYRWAGAVHEAITPAGSILYADVAVTHRKTRPSDPDRNLRIFEKLLGEGQTLGPREQFYYARELYYHKRYADAIAAFRAFLDGGQGWVENNIDACRQLSLCYRALDDGRHALLSLLESMAYGTPRAEVCCDIGRIHFDRADYKTAVFWYELAAGRERDDRSGAFVEADCYDYIPYLQLCVCYDRMGDKSKANAYNELAGQAKPGDPAVEQNRAYFARLT